MISNDPKYIIFETGADEMSIMFPNHMTHGNMALMMGNYTPISAGFFTIMPEGAIVVHGESISLGLRPRKEEDERILTKVLLQITI